MLKRREGRNENRDHDRVIQLAKAIGEAVDAGDLSKARRKVIRLFNRMAMSWTGWEKGHRAASMRRGHRAAKRLHR